MTNIFDDLTPEQAQVAIADAEGRDTFRAALFDKCHPDHDDAVQARSELYDRAYSGVDGGASVPANDDTPPAPKAGELEELTAKVFSGEVRRGSPDHDRFMALRNAELNAAGRGDEE